MEVIRLYDPSRRPPNWTEIIKPGQFAAFAKDLATGHPRDQDGRPFARADETTVVLFDSFDSARSFSEERVQRVPSIVFDIFDAEGRTQPPLLTVINSASAESIEDSPGRLKRRSRVAYALLLASVPAFALQYWWNADGVQILPMFIGINLVIAGGRLLLMNVAARDTDRRRQERLAHARSPKRG